LKGRAKLPWYQYIWSEETIDHLDQHGISPEDFEYVVAHAKTKLKSRSSGLPGVKGFTEDGRLIIAIFEKVDEVTIVPVTAYEIAESEPDDD
jgi:hypothetical protein